MLPSGGLREAGSQRELARWSRVVHRRFQTLSDSEHLVGRFCALGPRATGTQAYQGEGRKLLRSAPLSGNHRLLKVGAM